MSDNENLPVPAPAPAEYESDAEPVPVHPGEPDVGTLHTLASLLMGGALEGADELTRRLRQGRETTRSDVVTARASLEETDRDRLRYALIGLLLEARGGMSQGLSAVERISGRTTRLFSQALSPVTNSRLMKPLRRRYDLLIVRGESEVDRWIRRGRMEERRSRALARRVIDDVVDELVDYLAENPELRELVQQQSVGLASDVVDEFRERAVTADMLVEQVARALFRRVPREELPALPAVQARVIRAPQDDQEDV